MPEDYSLTARYALRDAGPVLAAAQTTIRAALLTYVDVVRAVKPAGGAITNAETIDEILRAENEVYRKAGVFPYSLDDRITLSISLPPGTLAAGR